MQQKRRSIGFILTLLCTCTLLLAACQTGTSSNRHTLIQHTARLNLRETPATLDTTTPGTTTPGTTTITPAEYIGQVPAEDAWIGLATTQKRMVAFVTDGSKDHQATFAQWFRGSVTNGVVDATSPAKIGADRLQGTLDGTTATGTVTFASGKSLAFTANTIPASDQTAGLYRSEHMVNKQRYVAGWIVLPQAGAQGTATPSLIGTATPSITSTTSPSILSTTTPSTISTATPSNEGRTVPSLPGSPTPSATETSTPSATGTLQQGGAILNEQNYTVLPVPPLTQEQIKAKQISIPNVATFKVVPCQQNLC